MVLTSLGLAHDKSKLPARGPVPASRAFRTSQQVPFGAQMVWEKFSCASSYARHSPPPRAWSDWRGRFSGPQIRLVLNDATLPLPACVSGASKKYGTCALADFVKANKAALGVQWMGQTWNASCSP
jgi:acid phosphatase